MNVNLPAHSAKLKKQRKLDSKDEFLLTLMKLRLRLALLNQVLAQQLEISERLVTKVIHSWLKAMAEYLNAFVYMYGIENILATTHQRYRQKCKLHFQGLLLFQEPILEE